MPNASRPIDGKDLTKLVGLKLGNYRLERLIGRGRMGVVYLAKDEALLRPTAIKLLSWKESDAQGHDPVRWFLAEARLVARINHPRVVQIYGAARQDEHCYIAMEYVVGRSGEAMVSDGPVAPEVATDILLQAAAALHAAHRSGVIHRDVKPANLLVGAGGVTKLGDFGMALGSAEVSAGNAHVRVGTPYYTAPEIWTGGAATPASDVYSLGATYFHLLTGRPPFPGNDVAAVEQAHLRAPVPDPRTHVPTLPASCAALVARALAKEPQQRQASAMVLLWEARHVLQDLASAAAASAPAAPHPDPAAAVPSPPFAEDRRGPAPPAPEPLRVLGFTRRPFFDAAPPAIENGWEPLASARARILERIDLDQVPVLAITGGAGRGHSALCRRIAESIGRERLGVTLDASPAAGDRGLVQLLCRAAGAIVEEVSDEACLDALVERMSEERQHRNRTPVVMLTSVVVPHPSTNGLARIVEAARASGAFKILLTGASGLAAALERCRITPGDDRVPEVSLPPLEREDIERYVRGWIDATLAKGAGPIIVSRDASLLLTLRSEGALDRIDSICENMLVLASSEQRRTLCSWHAWTAADSERWATRPLDALPRRPAGWPPPEVADVIDVCRRGAGMPPWPRIAGREE
ncbi:MAG TPA: protein kinase [Anaeromyxobacter sp.]